MKRTQEAYDELKPAQDVFKKEQLIWYNMACYSCALGNKEEAHELLDKTIELGGDAVKTQALNDPDLQGVWVSAGEEIGPRQRFWYVTFRGSRMTSRSPRRRFLPILCEELANSSQKQIEIVSVLVQSNWKRHLPMGKWCPRQESNLYPIAGTRT